LLAPQIASFGYLDATAIRLLALTLVSVAALLLTSNLLYSLQKMRPLLTTDALMAFTKIILAALLIFLGFGYLGAVMGFVLSVLAFSLLRFKWLPLAKGVIEKKRIWRYALSAYFGDFGRMAISQGNIVVLSFLAPMASVGIFSLVFMLTTPMRVVPQVLSNAIMPIISQKWALNEKESIDAIITQAFKYSLFITVPVLLGFTVFSKEMILLMATSQYFGGIAILPILSAAYFLYGIASIFTGALYYTGKPNTNRDVSLAAGLLNLALCVALIPTFGITGAAAAFLASAALMFAASLYMLLRHLHISLARRPMAKILLSSAVFIALVLWLKTVLGSSLEAMLLNLAFSFTLYVALLLLIRFFDEADASTLGVLKSMAPKRLKWAVAITEKALRKFI
jgi:stage V sporulation protein B